MPRKWTDPDELKQAFTETLEKAVGNQKIKDQLLNRQTAKATLAREGNIEIPADVEITFYREEDLPLRVVVAIPQDDTGNGPKHLKPTFEDCWKCTYETYIRPNNSQ